MSDKKKKQVLSRLQRYCALEDRSIQKVKEKLYDIEDLSHEEREEILSSLLEDSFLDDERFVEAYVRSKINQNKWGRQKIRNGLIRHRIPEKLIDRGLAEMNKQAYRKNLKNLLLARQSMTDDPVAWTKYLLQKGYGYEEVLEEIGN